MSTSGLVTILFTDLVGSTDVGTEIGDIAADELRRDHFADLRDAIGETGGREVKTIGDAIMVSYGGAADALAGAVAMQRSVERRNRRSDGPALAMRIGVSAGDATFEDDDWFGTPVIEASRLCAQRRWRPDPDQRPRPRPGRLPQRRRAHPARRAGAEGPPRSDLGVRGRWRPR